MCHASLELPLLPDVRRSSLARTRPSVTCASGPYVTEGGVSPARLEHRFLHLSLGPTFALSCGIWELRLAIERKRGLLKIVHDRYALSRRFFRQTFANFHPISTFDFSQSGKRLVVASAFDKLPPYHRLRLHTNPPWEDFSSKYSMSSCFRREILNICVSVSHASASDDYEHCV